MTAHRSWSLHELENGLRVLLVPDSRQPLVATVVYYDVGARNERPGQTGFAHLFEHMMFQASRHVGKNEFFRYIEAWGGVFNGNTTHERTVYFEVLPEDQLPLALWLEADRMSGLSVTEEHLQNQLDTVREERRFRYDNAPYMGGWLYFNRLAYQNFANAHPVIGEVEDLERATLADVQAFFERYYRPNHALLVVGGSLDPAAALDWVAYYFQDLAPGPPREPVDVTEPPLGGPRFELWPDPHARVPGLLLGYRLPPWGADAFYPLWVLYTMLATGRGSFLYQKFVRELALAVEVQGIWDARYGPGMMDFLFLVRPGTDLAELVERVQQELDAYARRLTDADVERAQRLWWRDQLDGWQRILDYCLDLGEAALLQGTPEALERDERRFLAVTPDQVREALRTWLTPEHRVALGIVPAEEGGHGV